jgi:hypothetical protein
MGKAEIHVGTQFAHLDFDDTGGRCRTHPTAPDTLTGSLFEQQSQLPSPWFAWAPQCYCAPEVLAMWYLDMINQAGGVLRIGGSRRHGSGTL